MGVSRLHAIASHHGTLLIGARAATRGHIATEGGDERVGVKALPDAGRLVVPNLSELSF
jgi:hypothetical protein